MPRVKKITLVEKQIKALNDVEKSRLYHWASKHTMHEHTTQISSASCGIGVVTILRCIDCNVFDDITHYESW